MLLGLGWEKEDLIVEDLVRKVTHMACRFGGSCGHSFVLGIVLLERVWQKTRSETIGSDLEIGAAVLERGRPSTLSLTVNKLIESRLIYSRPAGTIRECGFDDDANDSIASLGLGATDKINDCIMCEQDLTELEAWLGVFPI